MKDVFHCFFLYQYDIHNLDIEKKTILADPRAAVRWENISIADPLLEREEVALEPTEKATERQMAVEVTAKAVKTLKLSAKFTCPECKAEYQKEGSFKKHIADVHGKNSEKSSGSDDKSLMCDFCEKTAVFNSGTHETYKDSQKV